MHNVYYRLDIKRIIVFKQKVFCFSCESICNVNNSYTCYSPHVGTGLLHPVPSVRHVALETPASVAPTLHEKTAVLSVTSTLPLIGALGISHSGI